MFTVAIQYISRQQQNPNIIIIIIRSAISATQDGVHCEMPLFLDLCPLSDDMLGEIASFLDIQTLCALSIASKSFRLSIICEQDRFWHDILQRLLSSSVQSAVDNIALYDRCDNNDENRTSTGASMSDCRICLMRIRWGVFYNEVQLKYRPISCKQTIVAMYREAVAAGEQRRQSRIDQINQQPHYRGQYIGLQELVGDFVLSTLSPPLTQFLATEALKIVIVGDKGVGKTSLYQPYVLNPLTRIGPYTSHPIEITIDNDRQIGLSMWDTTYHSRSTIRPLSYPRTSVFLVLFNIADPCSFQRVMTQWLPEIRLDCPNVPCILVGNKIDLRTNRAIENFLLSVGESFILSSEGEAMAKRTGCIAYVETAISLGIGVDQLFSAIVSAALMRDMKLRPARRRKCLVQ